MLECLLRLSENRLDFVKSFSSSIFQKQKLSLISPAMFLALAIKG